MCSELSCDERPLVTDYDYINITLNARPPQLRARRLAAVNRQLADDVAVNSGAHETRKFSSGTGCAIRYTEVPLMMILKCQINVRYHL